MTAPVIRKGYVETDAGQLHFKSTGDDGGDPVVLLQILPLSTQLFDDLLILMGRQGYRPLAFDLMGYGQSASRDRVWMVEDFAANLRQALDRLDVRPVGVIAGHFTAMVAVHLELTAPGRLGRLVLDGVPLWSRETAAARLAAQQPLEILDIGGDVLLKRWSGVMGLLKRLDPDLTLTAQNQSRVFAAFSHFAQIGLGPDATSPIMAYDLAASLAKLAAPTLVIGSPTDTLRESHETAVSLIAGAQAHLFQTVHPLYPFDGSGNAADYLNVIDPFLRNAQPRMTKALG